MDADRPDISIIVPTYREAENLSLLVPRIAEAMAAFGRPYELLIVDDDSRDGTERVVEQLAGEHPVRLITRRGERDLSLAVLEGFRQARGNVFVVMDADLSHPPERIGDLVRALESGGAEFVIGSRFAPGGRTEGWGGKRRLNSYVAALLCRPLTPGIADPMAGFFALRRETLARADRLDPIGYKIGLELLCRCRCHPVAEVPITFHDRARGRSKLNLEQQIRYLRHLDRLYRDHPRRALHLFRPLLWLLRNLLRAVKAVQPRTDPRRLD